MSRILPGTLVLALIGSPVLAQDSNEDLTSTENEKKVVVTVNGHPIYEKQLQRRLRQLPPTEHARAREELLAYLIDNALVDQYLMALKIQVEASEVDAKLEEFKSAAEKSNQDYAEILKAFLLSEEEFRNEVTDLLRWDKFVAQQTTDEKLSKFFEANRSMFDGSAVRARHILLTPDAGNPESVQDAIRKLNTIKSEIEAVGKQAASKLPEDADALEREQARTAAMDQAFATAAREQSECPSKRDGGDLRWFPRIGAMDEIFAKTAFALETFQISEPIATPFGQHLIMVVDRRVGQSSTKFEDVKEVVEDVYSSRLLREAVIKQMKPRSKIVFNESN